MYSIDTYYFDTHEKAEEYIKVRTKNTIPQYEELYFSGPYKVENVYGVQVKRYAG